MAKYTFVVHVEVEIDDEHDPNNVALWDFARFPEDAPGHIEPVAMTLVGRLMPTKWTGVTKEEFFGSDR